MIELFRSDDSTPLTGLTIDNEQAGADSDTVVFHAKNTGLTTDKNLLILQRTVNPLNPTQRLATGAPPQDQMWGRIRITGYDNTADPTWSVASTSWESLGAYCQGPIVPTVPPDCIVYYEYLSHPPGDADELSWTRSLVANYNAYSQPIPTAIGRYERGVLHGIGDASRSGLVYGSINAEDTPGDTVIFWPAIWMIAGRLYSKVTSHPTLNQNDVAAAALAAGQSYWATVSVGLSGGTVTKGTKATSPTKPAVPTGEKLIGYVKVDYQIGGTSIIDAADVINGPGPTDYAPAYDRYHAREVGDLNLYISGGQAIGGGTWRYSCEELIVPLDDDTTNYVWQLASGLFTANTTGVAPESTALIFYEADTAGSVITEIRDRRTYAGEREVLVLGGTIPGSPGEIDSLMVADDHLVIERPQFRISDNGGGASGETKFDVLVNGTTIYTSSGTDDTRSVFAFDAATLTDDQFPLEWGTHEVFDLYRGDVITFENVSEPVGGTPAKAWAHLLCRKP